MRFIVRFRGQGAAPRDDVATVRAVPGARVLDESARMLLIEAPSRSALIEVEWLPNWVVAAETSVPLPDARASLPRG